MARVSAQKPGRVLLRRLAWIGGGIAVLFFTVEGGEYGTRDLWSQKGRRAQLDADVAQLRLDVDSLRQELKAFKTDNSKLERLAREKYGMVKGSKELLYRFESTSGRAGAEVNAIDSSGKRAR